MSFYLEIAQASTSCFVMLLGALVGNLRHAFLPGQVGHHRASIYQNHKQEGYFAFSYFLVNSYGKLNWGNLGKWWGICKQCISMKDGLDTWLRRCASPLDMKGW